MTEDRLTTVAFTGHRTYGGQAATALRATVGELYARGFRTFLCGMAMGFDLAAAEAVLACRDSQTASALSPAAASAAAFPSAAASAAVPPASVLSPAAASAAAFPSVAASAAVPPASVFSPAAASVAAFPSVAASAAVPPASAFSPAVDSVSAFFPEPHSPHMPMPGLRLVAVIPFRGQESRFPAADRERFRRVLAAADHSVTLSPSYHAGCYAVRNNYLVEHAALLVAWYDGSPGGTHYTVRRALVRGLEFINLHPHSAALRQAEPTLF
ncbi:SLOG family protein [Alistipes finegoldii]|uniref:SLOG family protein n=1 Tax=Alistipes finegoldii TaxID=214856 RepID=UPI002FDC9008